MFAVSPTAGRRACGTGTGRGWGEPGGGGGNSSQVGNLRKGRLGSLRYADLSQMRPTAPDSPSADFSVTRSPPKSDEARPATRLAAHSMMRWLQGFLAIVALGSAAAWGWLAYVDRDLPKHQGRSVRSWFWELCRIGSVPQQGLERPTRELECKMAILLMGTNALPYLAQQALSGKQDGWLRSQLHHVSSKLPRWVGGSLCPPHLHIQGQAAWFFRPLQPPASLVRRLAASTGDPRRPDREQMETVLWGSVGDGAETVLPELIRSLEQAEDPWLRAVAARSIRWLGIRGADAWHTVLAILARPPQDPELIDWIAALGSGAEKALPRLEGLLEVTDPKVRFHAAAALLQIRPDHAQALETFKEVASPDLPITAVTSALRDQCLEALTATGNGSRTNETLGALWEPLARLEILGWKVGNKSGQATRVLERYAPGRADELYRKAMRGAGSVPAATGLLRIHRSDNEATEWLAAHIREGGENTEAAILALSEASASNTSALRCLTEVAGHGNRSGGIDAIPETALRNRVRAADYALARIRFRDRLVGLGLDEREW